MTVTHPADAETGKLPSQTRDARRTKRSIRFSDPEWKQVEKAAAKRGITASEHVRNAALNAIDGTSPVESGGLSPELVEIIKLTHRSAYILSTLKRDEMIREGRAREMDEVVRDAHNAPANLLSSESSRRNEPKEQ